MLTWHIRESLQVTPGPFLDFWAGPGDKARYTTTLSVAHTRMQIISDGGDWADARA